MSAIGDYVHMLTKNYLTYGTSYYGQSPSEPASASYGLQKAQNDRIVGGLPKLPLESLQELRRRVMENSLANQQADQSKSKADFQKNMIAVLKVLKEKVPTHVYNAFVSDSSQGWAMPDQRKVGRTGIVRKQNIAGLQKKLTALNNRVNDINSRSNAGVAIQNRTIRSLIKQYDQIADIVGQARIGASIYNDYVSDLDSILGQMKDTIRLYSTSNAITAASGWFGQALGVMASDGMKELGLKQLKQAIAEALSTGQGTSSFSMDQTHVAKGPADLLKQDGLNVYQSHSSQNKVDAFIQVNGDKIAASVKAGKTASPTANTTHSLQTVSLLNSLAITQGQFGNHWLNMHAALGYTDPSALDEQLQRLVAYQALSAGNLLKQDSNQASALLSIDTTFGRVTAVSAHSIMTERYDQFKFYPAVATFDFSQQNRPADTVNRRLANLIHAVNRSKVRVSYSIQY